MQQTQTARLVMTPGTVARRALAVLAGVVAVALSAQVAIPVPGTPVPVKFPARGRPATLMPSPTTSESAISSAQPRSQ